MEKVVFDGMIDLAIKREIEAYDFYSRVSQTLTNKALADIFTELAQEERGHRSLLEALKEKSDSHINFVPPKTDYHLAEQTELPPLSTDMKPADAFALAMKKEQQAAEFYQDLAERSTDDAIKDMCLNLSSMELQHKQKIEKAYIDVAYVESF